MSSSRARVTVGVLVSVVGGLSATGAAAASTPFGCRASIAAVRPATPLPAVEPYVANRAATPCATDVSGATAGQVGTIAIVGPAGAYTYSSSSADPSTGAVAPGATALVSVNGATLATSTGAITLPGPAQTQVSYACVNGSAVPSASSTLSTATVNGQTISLTTPGAEQTIPLGGGSYVTLNQRLQTATSLTERLVVVHLAGVGDLVLGESAVTLGADPCAGAGGAGGGSGGSGGGSGGGGNGGGSGGGGNGGGGRLSPSLGACPPGSVLVPSDQQCEIIVSGVTGVMVSRPFEGPTGGTVVTLASARRKYRSGCLYGPGPKFAIVGTNGADRIQGTRRADRILGLGGNDRIAGQGGNDCIDAGAGNDRVFGGDGNDRIYGGPGSDRLSVQNGSSSVWGGAGADRIVLGNGNDRVWGGAGADRISVGRGSDRVSGGSGADTISAGNGNDWVWGGAGNDRILVGTGRDHLFGGPGRDRLFGPGLVVYVACGGGRDIVYVNASGMRYARAHGCPTVRKIRTHVL